MSAWTRLGTRSPSELVEARLELHWAAQIVAAAAEELVKRREDDSHTALEVRPETSRLASAPSGASDLRVALSIPDLKLLLADSSSATLSEMELAHRTLEDGLRWLRETVTEHCGLDEAPKLELPAYEMPEHAVSSGAAFSAPDSEALRELAAWFRNGVATLQALAERLANPTPVVCWPHHFDTAFLSRLDPDADPEAARSIGVGLSPGDDHIPEPYFYVTPWPPPNPSSLPPLGAGGEWQTEGFVSAVLKGSELVRAGEADEQHRVAISFLTSASEAAREAISHA